jgi:Transposase DDE domain
MNPIYRQPRPENLHLIDLFGLVKLADSFRLNPGSIVAIDRGYIDFALFGRWSMAGVFFVTRLKDNAAFEVVEECVIPQNRNIRADQFIRLTGAQAQADYPDLLRRIVAWDPENEREIILLTNLVEFGATTIAAIYKERWQIELFFKALKQNLTVKPDLCTRGAGPVRAEGATNHLVTPKHWGKTEYLRRSQLRGWTPGGHPNGYRQRKE